MDKNELTFSINQDFFKVFLIFWKKPEKMPGLLSIFLWFMLITRLVEKS